MPFFRLPGLAAHSLDIKVVVAATALFPLAILALLAAVVFDLSLFKDNLCTQNWSQLTDVYPFETADFVSNLGEDKAEPFSGQYCSLVLNRLIAIFVVATVIGALGAIYLSRKTADNDSAERAPKAWHALHCGVVIALLMLTGLVMRLPILGVGLWRDEASSYFNAVLDDPGAFWERLIFSELNPPAYYLLLHEWIGVFGANDIAIKLPSLVFGLLMIPTAYLLGRTVGSPAAGLIAAWLATISHDSIYYSQEARPYTFAAVLATLTTVFAIRSFQGRHQGWFLFAFALSGATLIYVHYSGLIFLGVLFLGTMFLAWRKAIEGPLLLHLSAYTAIFFLYLPWLLVFFQHLQTGTPWTVKASLSELPVLYARNLSHSLPWDGGPLSKLLVDMLILAALGASLVRYLRWERAARNRNIPSDASILILGASFFLIAAIFTGMSYSGRYLFPFLSLVHVFLSIWLLRLIRLFQDVRWFSPEPVALCLVLGWIGATSWHLAIQDRWDKSGIRALAEETIKKGHKGTIFVISPDFLSPTFAYYLRDQDAEFIGFARQNDPEIFSPLGYADYWQRSALDQLTSIIQKRRDAGARNLVLVRHRCGTPSQNNGELQYSLANEAADIISETYPTTNTTYFPGFSECVLATDHCLQGCDDVWGETERSLPAPIRISR